MAAMSPNEFLASFAYTRCTDSTSPSAPQPSSTDGKHSHKPSYVVFSLPDGTRKVLPRSLPLPPGASFVSILPTPNDALRQRLLRRRRRWTKVTGRTDSEKRDKRQRQTGPRIVLVENTMKMEREEHNLNHDDKVLIGYSSVVQVAIRRKGTNPVVDEKAINLDERNVKKKNKMMMKTILLPEQLKREKEMSLVVNGEGGKQRGIGKNVKIKGEDGKFELEEQHQKGKSNLRSDILNYNETKDGEKKVKREDKNFESEAKHAERNSTHRREIVSCEEIKMGRRQKQKEIEGECEKVELEDHHGEGMIVNMEEINVWRRENKMIKGEGKHFELEQPPGKRKRKPISKIAKCGEMKNVRRENEKMKVVAEKFELEDQHRKKKNKLRNEIKNSEKTRIEKNDKINSNAENFELEDQHGMIKSKVRSEIANYADIKKARTKKNEKTKGDAEKFNLEKQHRKRKKGRRSPQLSKAQKMSDAYLRLPAGVVFLPPPSPYQLLQEDHAWDPWRVLVICILLNVTTGEQVRRILSDFFQLCPDAKTTIGVDNEVIEDVIRSLGLYRKRVKIIKRFSREYLNDSWTHVTQLHGVGKYAADAYAILCAGQAHLVEPHDHMLVPYWKFMTGK